MLRPLVGRPQDAVEHLKKSSQLEPWFALPLRHLGEANDRLSNAGDATSAYRSFLKIASRNDAQRPQVEKRLVALASAVAR